MRGLHCWSHLLKGTTIPVLVFTDHANLCYYWEPRKIGPCVAVSGTHYLWVARLNDGMELKVTDPKEQQGDVDEEEAEGERRGNVVGRAGC